MAFAEGGLGKGGFRQAVFGWSLALHGSACIVLLGLLTLTVLAKGYGERLLKGFGNPNVDFINAHVMMYLHDGGLLNKNAKRLF